MWLLGVFFDPAHIFTNLVSKKIKMMQGKVDTIFHNIILKKKNRCFINIEVVINFATPSLLMWNGKRKVGST
ncbi:hypothetical protein BV924_14060 [Pectobacterium odoriferum]|uniref:Uncharacterized protein n=1 Tax=Pectobacterium odoriferum TaxID=78398 RepID=A0ABD6VMV3_9GAMM|nr:hypothetical protein BVY06_15510 [Pectobacterium odoriferum]POE11948.1 hypothetical protein BV924_14060 [Pectobacterium odoriferum]POE25835.1 hypothetical protein BV926_14140 [Pectobacterium odoriferum]POE30277.1 hypothetical protein BV919_14085 [Pectobacterium odoriferum]POE39270.1 hypothetical protein BV920_13075 [Pectobacterium odoriferum]